MLRILILLLILKGTLMAIEEPKYTVIQKNDTFEIREYAPYVLAQTEVTGTFEEMGSKAFRILFKYISGENQTKNSIEMTAAVLQENKQAKGQKIQMTAPVIQDLVTSNPNRAVYSFVMPEKFTLATLPKPLDERITLKEIAAKRVAVRVFSGFWCEENFQDNESTLLNALAAANLKTIGSVSYARYNSPFSLWFMRRNEVMIQVSQ